MSLIPKKPANPEAARLANFYVPLILAKMGWSGQKTEPEAPKKEPTEFEKRLAEGFKVMMRAQQAREARMLLAANGYQPDRLDSQDWEALAELPL